MTERCSDRQAGPLLALILCGSPIYARALQMLLTSEQIPSHLLLCPFTGVDPPDLSDASYPTYPASRPSVVLVAPSGWEEMGAWVPLLQKRLSEIPWLLLTQYLIAGVFLSYLEPYCCAVVDPNASARELLAALRATARGDCGHLTAELMAQFARTGCRSPSGGRTPLPSRLELQCACAASLGLSNEEIAHLLYLSESGVKSHLYRLMHKLHVTNRRGLELVIKQAFD